MTALHNAAENGNFSTLVNTTTLAFFDSIWLYGAFDIHRSKLRRPCHIALRYTAYLLLFDKAGNPSSHLLECLGIKITNCLFF